MTYSICSNGRRDHRIYRQAAAFLWIFVMMCASCFAQSNESKLSVNAQLDQYRVQLDQVQATLKRSELKDSTLGELLQQLTPVASSLNTIINNLVPKLDNVAKRRDQLEPSTDQPTSETQNKGSPATSPGAKAEGRPLESTHSNVEEKPSQKPPAVESLDSAEKGEKISPLETERLEIQRQYDELDALLRRARALAVETNQTVDDISSRRRSLFTRELFKRSSSIFSPTTWSEAIADFPKDFRAINVVFGDFFQSIVERISIWKILLILMATALCFVGNAAVRRLIKQLSEKSVIPETEKKATPVANAVRIPILRKLLSGAYLFLIAIAPALFGIGLALFVFWILNFSHPRFNPFFIAIIKGILNVAFSQAMARTILRPDQPEMRLISITNEFAIRITRSIIILSVIISATHILESLFDLIGSAVPLLILMRGSGAVLIAGFGIRLLQQTGTENENDIDTVSWSGPLRTFLWAASVVILSAVAIGYITLASFLVDQIAWLFILFGLFLPLFLLINAITAVLTASNSDIPRRISLTTGLKPQSVVQMAIIGNGVTNVTLFFALAGLILLPWGLQSNDFFNALANGFSSLTIGGITFSPGSIFWAVLFFAVILAATRVVQNWLDTKFLPATHLDLGLRNAIKTSLGYIGFVLAVSFACGIMGVSFDKLAIVAGALSVGIGFGLQSIVSNFVSGLILLWERAIRVGDWIVLGEDQGYVRRINVRSTEIETFDRLTLIVPNSNLVSGVVKNWVRGDKVGRLKVSMTLNNDADIDKARQLLIGAAKEQQSVLRIPTPTVSMTSFTQTTCQLDLFFYVEDVEGSLRVRSDILFELHTRFKSAGLISGPAAPGPAAVVTINGAEGITTDGKAHTAIQNVVTAVPKP